MQGDCLVNILLTSFIKPAAKHSPALSSPLCLYLALLFSCTHISSRGLTGKGYSGSTLWYNQRRWSNSLLSIYTHIQFVGTLRGVSGEVFVWLDHSGAGPPPFQLLWAWVCACTKSPQRHLFRHINLVNIPLYIGLSAQVNNAQHKNMSVVEGLLSYCILKSHCLVPARLPAGPPTRWLPLPQRSI